MTDSYSLIFDWPHTDAHSVIVTGTFDNWSSSVHLQKGQSGFTGSVAVPWDTKILYKFIVDGNWVTHSNQPTETDGSGFVNNVVHTPSKPAPPPASEPEVAVAPEETKKEAVEPEAPPVEVAPKVPIPIQPVLDGSTDATPVSKPTAAETEASTHQPAPAGDVAPEASAAPAPAPSTPPQKKEELPAQVPAPVTPIKTDGLAAAAHARTSTSGSTAPSSSAPSTPKTQNTFPTTEGGDGGSPSSKFGSVGKRQKRQSFFGKLRARLSGSPDKKEKKRFGSEEPRSGSPTPTPKKNGK